MNEMVSVIICVKNSEKLLRDNLPILRTSIPHAELIVVDGDSIDSTRTIAEKFADIVVSDEGKGLAYARQLGVINANKRFVLFSGPDNRLSKQLLDSMIEALNADPFLAGVSSQTDVVDANTYWECTTKYFFKYLINRPGLAVSIGTPCMFKRDIILHIPYDERIKAAGDDTDLSLRLYEAGYRLAIINEFSQEKNELNFAGFVNRWRWYGKGDAEFYEKHQKSWPLSRRLQSLTHPFWKYMIKGAFIFLINGKPQYIPGLYLGVFARYQGWLMRANELKEKVDV